MRLALDDFGTGYSSLSYLRRLPIDIVKIDQSFIADIGATPTGRAPIVAAVIDLAHVLGLTVDRRGRRDAAPARRGRGPRLRSSQGYFFAEPMPAEAFGERLGSRPGRLRLPMQRTTTALAGSG